MNVYICNLPLTYTKTELDALFSKFGRITSSRLILRSADESRGIAFVRYALQSDAEKCIATLTANPPTECPHLVVRAAKTKTHARSDTNVYMCDLPQDLTKESFDNICAQFGAFESSVVLEGQKKQGCIAFVRFSHHEDAKSCIKKLHGSCLREEDEKPITVRFARLGDKRSNKEQQNSSAPKFSSVPQVQYYSMGSYGVNPMGPNNMSPYGGYYQWQGRYTPEVPPQRQCEEAGTDVAQLTAQMAQTNISDAEKAAEFTGAPPKKSKNRRSRGSRNGHNNQHKQVIMVQPHVQHVMPFNRVMPVQQPMMYNQYGVPGTPQFAYNPMVAYPSPQGPQVQFDLPQGAYPQGGYPARFW